MTSVTVLIPFHNRVSWTREALDSVLGQTDSDFEVILVGNGSTEALSRLRPDDERVRFVRRDRIGAAAARNAGIRLARGKYIALLDSDDLFLPHKLETQVAYMERHPELPLTHTSYYRIDEHGRRIAEVDSAREFSGRVYPRILLHCPIASSTVMVRRDVLPRGTCFEESLTTGYDEILWIRLAKRLEFGAIAEPLSEIRIHGTNATDDPERQIEAKQAILRYAVRHDGDLRGRARQVVLSETYAAIGEFHWLRRRRLRFLAFTARAVAAWPLNGRLYRFLGSSALRYVRARKRRLRALLTRRKAA